MLAKATLRTVCGAMGTDKPRHSYRRSREGSDDQDRQTRNPNALDGVETTASESRAAVSSATRAAFRYMKGRVMRARKLQVRDVED